MVDAEDAASDSGLLVPVYAIGEATDGAASSWSRDSDSLIRVAIDDAEDEERGPATRYGRTVAADEWWACGMRIARLQVTRGRSLELTL